MKKTVKIAIFILDDI